MIQATLKHSGALVNKCRTSYLLIEDETQLAVRRKNEETGKIEEFTIAEIFDVFHKKSSYKKNMGEQEESFGAELFESWFMSKYIVGRGMENNLLEITYERI